METQEILNLKFHSNDLGKEVTIREFFQELLTTLWDEKESFSGKRPFGNGGWEYGVMACLIKNNIVDGELDENGYVNTVNNTAFDELVKFKIIPGLFNPAYNKTVLSTNRELLKSTIMKQLLNDGYGVQGASDMMYKPEIEVDDNRVKVTYQNDIIDTYIIETAETLTLLRREDEQA